MSERGILFSGPMVRAILAGRKMQTRRLVKWRDDARPVPDVPVEIGEHALLQSVAGGVFGIPIVCPYGAPGDRLWVRETWRTDERTHNGEKCVDGILFRADDSFVKIANTRAAADLWVEAHDNGKHGDDWRPSIFMPRWASRLTLELTDVRVERLQAITEADARAEGITRHACGWSAGSEGYDTLTARGAFEDLWDSINGKRDGASWTENPWVWVLTFKRTD